MAFREAGGDARLGGAAALHDPTIESLLTHTSKVIESFYCDFASARHSDPLNILDPMQAPGDERRSARRYEIDLNVTLDGSPAEARNVSSSGLYAISSRSIRADEDVEVDFELPMLTAGGTVRCVGRVTRVVVEPKGVGVAIKFHAWDFT